MDRISGPDGWMDGWIEWIRRVDPMNISSDVLFL